MDVYPLELHSRDSMHELKVHEEMHGVSGWSKTFRVSERDEIHFDHSEVHHASPSSFRFPFSSMTSHTNRSRRPSPHP